MAYGCQKFALYAPPHTKSSQRTAPHRQEQAAPTYNGKNEEIPNSILPCTNLLPQRGQFPFRPHL